MRRKQKSPAARRTKRVKGLNNKPTENGEPLLGAASLVRAWKPKRQKTASHLSELHLSRVRGNQNDLIQRQKQVITAASRVRVETSAGGVATSGLEMSCISRVRGNQNDRKATTKSRLQEFDFDYLFSLFSNAEVIVRAKIYKP